VFFGRRLPRHLRACRRILRRNATLGPDALGFAAMVEQWLLYWHFACVTRQISGTDFGNVAPPPAAPSNPQLAATSRTPAHRIS